MLYAPERLERIQLFRKLAKGATAERFTAGAEGYTETTQGQIEAIEAEGLRRAATATPEERIGLALIEAGEEEWTRLQARDDTSFWMPDSQEKSIRTVWGPLMRRARELEKAKQKGNVPEELYGDITELVQFLSQEIPTVKNLLTAAEVGKAEGMLRKLEPQIINIHNSSDLNLNPRVTNDPANREAGQTRTGDL